jgi:hypothetical protein
MKIAAVYFPPNACEFKRFLTKSDPALWKTVVVLMEFKWFQIKCNELMKLDLDYFSFISCPNKSKKECTINNSECFPRTK